MPFPPSLDADPDETSPAFIAPFQAYLAGTVPAWDLPGITGTFTGLVDDPGGPSPGPLGRSAAGDPVGAFISLSGELLATALVSGTLLSRSDFPPASVGTFLGGLLGFVGGADTPLPAPHAPEAGPIGVPTQGAAGRPYPPPLGEDPGAMPFGALFSGTEAYHQSGYFLGVFGGVIGQAEGEIGSPPLPTPVIVAAPAPRLGPIDPIGTYPAYLRSTPDDPLHPSSLSGIFEVSDPDAGPLTENQNLDPSGSQAQLDGEIIVLVGETQPPFTTTRLPRLAFGPFINLSGLTYQVELAAFAKFGLAQVQFRLYANDQALPPFNTIGLAGLNAFVTSLVATLTSPAADLLAEARLTDAFGNVASVSVVLRGIPDTQGPTPPSFLFIAQLPAGPWLFVWGEAQDDFAISHYRLDQVDASGLPIATLASNLRQNYYTVDAPNLSGQRYRVVAFDPASNVSASSPIATAIASATSGPRITSVLARQVAGTGTIHVSWTVDPAGTPCTAVVVDARERPLSDTVVTTIGQATLTLSSAIGSGIYRVRVGTA